MCNEADVFIVRKDILVEFQLEVNDVIRKWGKAILKTGDEVSLEEDYLIDEILDRLDKMNRERKYCNIYSRGVYAVESIRATIRVVDDELDTLEEIPVPELMDAGYPDEDNGKLRDKDGLRAYCGEALAAKMKDRT